MITGDHFESQKQENDVFHTSDLPQTVFLMHDIPHSDQLVSVW